MSKLLNQLVNLAPGKDHHKTIFKLVAIKPNLLMRYRNVNDDGKLLLPGGPNRSAGSLGQDDMLETGRSSRAP